jgi:hypothetical protein
MSPSIADPVPKYSIQDLGALGGLSSEGDAINNNGDVAGYRVDSNNVGHIFIYSAGKMQDVYNVPADWKVFVTHLTDTLHIHIFIRKPHEFVNNAPPLYDLFNGQLSAPHGFNLPDPRGGAPAQTSLAMAMDDNGVGSGYEGFTSSIYKPSGCIFAGKQSTIPGNSCNYPIPPDYKPNIHLGNCAISRVSPNGKYALGFSDCNDNNNVGALEPFAFEISSADPNHWLVAPGGPLVRVPYAQSLAKHMCETVGSKSDGITVLGFVDNAGNFGGSVGCGLPADAFVATMQWAIPDVEGPSNAIGFIDIGQKVRSSAHVKASYAKDGIYRDSSGFTVVGVQTTTDLERSPFLYISGRNIAGSFSRPKLNDQLWLFSDIIQNSNEWNFNVPQIHPLKWGPTVPLGINGSGQIVGTAFHNGAERAFILTPQP